jgi:hypothetical protein
MRLVKQVLVSENILAAIIEKFHHRREMLTNLPEALILIRITIPFRGIEVILGLKAAKSVKDRK